MKKLLPLIAGAFLLNCQSKPISNNEVLPPPIVRIEPKRSEFHEVLRDYIYNLYDQSLGIPTPEFNTSKNTLEECLRAARFSREDSRLIFEGKHVIDLEEYFKSQGLVFRCSPVSGQLSPCSYELLRLSEPEQKEMAVFGISKKYKKRIVMEELIANCYNYEGVKTKSNAVLLGSHVMGTDEIDYRPLAHDAALKVYFDGEAKEGVQLDAELKDLSLLDKYLKEGDVALFNRMRTIFHHLGIRDAYHSSNNFDEFALKVKPAWEHDVEVHEVMHSIDNFNLDQSIVSKLDDASKYELHISIATNMELRAMLAQIHQGDVFKSIGDDFQLLVGDEPGWVNEHQSAAKLIFYMFSHIIRNDRKNYSSIDISGGTNDIYRQLPKLSEAQLRTLAKSAFDELYEGKSFNVFINNAATDILRTQRRHR